MSGSPAPATSGDCWTCPILRTVLLCPTTSYVRARVLVGTCQRRVTIAYLPPPPPPQRHSSPACQRAVVVGGLLVVQYVQYSQTPICVEKKLHCVSQVFARRVTSGRRSGVVLSLCTGWEDSNQPRPNFESRLYHVIRSALPGGRREES